MEACLSKAEQDCRYSFDILVKGPTSPSSRQDFVQMLLRVRSETARQVVEAMLARGVKIRAIYERSVLDLPGVDAYLEHWRTLGEAQRIVDWVPFRAAVFDRTVALVPNAVESEVVKSLFVVRGGMAEAVAHTFDLLWQNTRIGPAPGMSVRPLTPEEIGALTLMCEGLSDHRIAKELGISVRTVQRRIADLGELFGTVSRPALAAKAVAAGLVMPLGLGSSLVPQREGEA